jgi:hypothetical protein
MFVLRHEGKPITFDSTRTLTNHFLSTSTPLSQHIVTTPLPAPETQFIFTDDRAPIEPLMVTQEINEEKPR